MDILRKLFDKNTNIGRGVRTAIQGFLALITFVYGLLLVPGLYDMLAHNNLVTAASFTTWLGIICYIQNALESLWEKIK